jgi:hypothetical protein
MPDHLKKRGRNRLERIRELNIDVCLAFGHVASEVVLVLRRVVLSGALRKTANFKCLSMSVFIRVGNLLEGTVESQHPEHRHIGADSHARFSQFQGAERIAIETGFGRGLSYGPSPSLPRDAYPFGELLQSLRDL